MTIKELIEKRARVWETAKNFVNTHENSNGVLSAEDAATYDRMEKEIEDLTSAIDRQQRAEQREAELNKPVNSPLTGRPYMAAQGGEEKKGRASDEYRKAMLNALRSNFRQVSNVLQEGVDADAMLTYGEDGAPVYGTPVALPGAVSISLDANGEPENFYADGIAYYVINNNMGYDGDLELALIPEDFRIAALNETLDEKKVLVENANTELVNEMHIESRNDDYEYAVVADQVMFDAF